ncbi:MAG TPA: hypothetical protein VH308_04175 [Terracidiphilus sp.]|jgi:hypothetical protein|nr:hypothetical protein [Terracidiphilus sp.]
MAIVVVGGSGRGVGKTTLICGLIAALPERSWIAVKISSHVHGTAHPMWEEKESGQGTDTARYRTAGARRAFLLSAPDGTALQRVLDQLWAECEAGANFIFESNRILEYVRPDLCLMVRGGTEPKPSFLSAVRVADAIVVRAKADQVPSENLAGRRRPIPVFHLASLEQISPAMRNWASEKLEHFKK